MKRVARITAVCLLSGAVALWGQQGGGGGTSSGGGNQGGGNNQGGGRGNQGGQQGNQNQDPFGRGQQQTMPQMPRPIFLSGKVLLGNGEIPPEPVTIERVCNGQNVPETYTDSKGNFSFQVGGDPTLAIGDASTSGFGNAAGGQFNGGFGGARGGFGSGIGADSTGMSVDLTGCEIRGSLPGFRSDSIQLGMRRALDNPEIGVIVLHSLSGYGGALVSATSLAAPKKAKSSYEKAMRELSKKSDAKPEKAISELEKAVEEYPDYAAAWTMIGETKARLGDSEGAEQAFSKALDADPKYMRPYSPLLRIQLQKKDWKRAEELCAAMLDVSPGYTQAQYFLALAQFNQGQLDDALTTVERVQKSDEAGEFPQSHQMAGMIHSQRGAFDAAAQSYRTYLELAPTAPSAEAIQKQLNEWEVLGVVQPAQ